jgi:hypothetical protein
LPALTGAIRVNGMSKGTVMKKWAKLALLLAAGLLASNSVLAAQATAADNTSATTTAPAIKAGKTTKPLRPAIQLDSIMPLKKTEKGGNEIYVGMSEFNSNGKNRYYTIPQSPVYWPQKSVTQISNFQLWQGKLPAGGATEVIISLIEKDTPPWKLDDLISIVKIKMMNKGGKISYEWYQDGKLISTKNAKVTVLLKGSQGGYKATLSLIMRDGTKAERSPNEMNG